MKLSYSIRLASFLVLIYKFYSSNIQQTSSNIQQTNIVHNVGVNTAELNQSDVDIASATAILNLASSFINDRVNYVVNNSDYPIVTLSYAQTLDGSM